MAAESTTHRRLADDNGQQVPSRRLTPSRTIVSRRRAHLISARHLVFVGPLLQVPLAAAGLRIAHSARSLTEAPIEIGHHRGDGPRATRSAGADGHRYRREPPDRMAAVDLNP
jgi:hypothetical protein